MPDSLTIFPKGAGSSPDNPVGDRSAAKTAVKSDRQGGGAFFWEAGAIAVGVAAGRKEHAATLFAETIRVMKIVCSTRKRSGANFLQHYV